MERCRAERNGKPCGAYPVRWTPLGYCVAHVYPLAPRCGLVSPVTGKACRVRALGPGWPCRRHQPYRVFLDALTIATVARATCLDRLLGAMTFVGHVVTLAANNEGRAGGSAFP